MIKRYKEPICCIFIFDINQIDSSKNKYFSSNAVQFMIESLEELAKEIKKKKGELYFFYGNVLKVLKSIHIKYNITEIGFNADYSPYSLQRDNEIKEWCEKSNIMCTILEDILLHNLFSGITLKDDETPYKVFTPYKRKCQSIPVKEIDKSKIKNLTKLKDIHTVSYFLKEEKIHNFYNSNPSILVRGGRKNALKILKNIKYFLKI